MATKPTRQQQQACDKLAESLLLITEAARLDGGGKFDRTALGDLAGRIAGVSSAFTLDEIVARALEVRGKALGLPSDAAELLTLMEADISTSEMLLLEDGEFRGRVGRMREKLWSHEPGRSANSHPRSRSRIGPSQPIRCGSVGWRFRGGHLD